jgi:hypothetical protein
MKHMVCGTKKRQRRPYFVVLEISVGIRIRRIRMFLGLPDTDPNPLVRGTDPDPNPLVRGTDPDPDPGPSLLS